MNAAVSSGTTSSVTSPPYPAGGASPAAIFAAILLALLSAFLATHAMTDLLAETQGSSVSTKRVLDELIVGENDKVVFRKQVQQRLNSFCVYLEYMSLQEPRAVVWSTNHSTPLLPGGGRAPSSPARYGLYWRAMEAVSAWYEPHAFQLVKLLLLTVALANLVAALLALLCHGLPCTGRVWCGHPTPLLLVEAALTLALLLLLLMLVLGRRGGLLGQQEAGWLAAVMFGIGFASWIIGDHYREERRVRTVPFLVPKCILLNRLF